MSLNLKVYKTHPDIELPKFATEESACFDLAYQNAGKSSYEGYSENNRHFTRYINIASFSRLVLCPGDRVLIPTGLIFDIPKGYSLRIHARSGLSLKSGLILANSEAVIDSDYIHEVMVLLYNRSQNRIHLDNGDRIAQAELVKQYKYNIVEITELPKQKTDRIGGMGSTGI